MSSSLFRSAFLGGFECSTHRRSDGRRLDLIAATRHDANVRCDYEQLAEHGLKAMRDGLRWHLIETAPGRYDWSSLLPMMDAARETGTQVIWDLCHYGYPDGIDIWSPEFVARFEAFAAAAAEVIAAGTDGPPFFCPVNEISFWAWAGGDVAEFNPMGKGRGDPLKRQLVRAAIAGVDAVRAVVPHARIVFAEPAVNIRPKFELDENAKAAEGWRLAQYQAYDMLTGAMAPELGGRPDILDIVGVNYYSFNNWYFSGGFIPMGHHHFRPFRPMLREIWQRYRRPMFIAETGAEGTARPAWLHYVCDVVRAARAEGVPVEGICLYPVLDYPGWENERLCDVGLLGPLPDGASRRPVLEDYAVELERQQALWR